MSDEILKIVLEKVEKVENKTEQLLAEQAITLISEGHEAPADQKELIRWYKKTNKKK